ncbi:Rqc2 family fibronectin-binding protein [Paenibacillus xerothermodurans]|uniref:Rqc2 homolog RqcH n=1 Tax=Paenibacillus xerothermodurans TaxID=1977292 RepID=A0A2W1P482_PAEXE|nr:NFACT RNA binding domain-containing protein [Paenibacillus xerothermodurans]PZE22532.1 fibronectin/fibrinogen-binding protein [Paenibacillus xerothermodurans]
MALDGLVVHSLVRELQTCVGGRISKVHMPTGNDIVLQLRAQGRNVKLILSANPTYPRVHFTEQTFTNPMEAPMFCMLLRKHCEGGVIESISQPGLERIIRFQVRQRDELGDISSKVIIVEIMGRHSNIILLDPATHTIIDGIHHVTPAISSYRIVMPGSAYTPPPEQHKAHPFETDKQRFVALLTAPQADAPHDHADSAMKKADSPTAEPPWDRRLVASFSGLSPLVARELVYRAEPALSDSSTPHLSAELIWDPFDALMHHLQHDGGEPQICVQPSGGKQSFSILELTHLHGESTRYESVSECLEAFYGDKAERDTVKQRVSDLLRFLQNERSKNTKKLEKLHATMEEAKDADKFRISGELLTASMHQIQKGDKQVEVINYYDEEQRPVRIGLDPLLTPSENAQRYFKKYTKSKNSLIAVREQIDHTHNEIAYLDSLLQQLGTASLSDVEEIRDELVEQGYIRDRNKKARKKKVNQRPLLSCFTSSEGVPIYVGKNNTQNEYLTNRLAQSGDTWLHTKDIPGSHVVIRSAQFGDATLHEAARLAAFFSQAKSSSQVPVDYTLIKHVRKPTGAKPGFVIYDHQRTLFVTPDAEGVKQMPVTIK